MAPEQIEAHPRPASDQYSLGIVAYEWLMGDRPFHGSFSEIAGKHSVVSPPSLIEQVPTLPPAVEQVVLIALAKDPKKRFGSVLAFATALEQASTVKQPELEPVVSVAETIDTDQSAQHEMAVPVVPFSSQGTGNVVPTDTMPKQNVSEIAEGIPIEPHTTIPSPKEEHLVRTEEEKRHEAMEERRRRRMAKRAEQTHLGMETHVQNIANQTSPIPNQSLPAQQPRLDLSIQARQAEQERLRQAEEKERVREGETERLHQTEKAEQIGKFAGSFGHTSQSRTTPSPGTNVVQSEETSKRSSGFSRWRYLLGFAIFLFGALFVGQYERAFLVSNHMDKVLFQIGSFAVTTSTVLFLLTLILLLVILAFFDLIPRSIKRSRG